MSTIAINDTIPEGTFKYVPYSPELEQPGFACGVPASLSTKEWAGKKVVLVFAPGAFTPTCHANHIPPFVKNYDTLKSKGVDVVAVATSNDVFVQSAWGRAEGFKDKVLALSDPEAAFAKSIGLTWDLSAKGVGLGVRTKRFALVLDNLVVKYLGVEPGPEVGVSGYDAVLAHL